MLPSCLTVLNTVVLSRASLTNHWPSLLSIKAALSFWSGLSIKADLLFWLSLSIEATLSF